MAGVAGFEPTQCKSQSLVPYRLATPQNSLPQHYNSILKNNQVFFLFLTIIFYKILSEIRKAIIYKNFYFYEIELIPIFFLYKF